MVGSLSAFVILASSATLVSNLEEISNRPGMWERWAFDVTNTEKFDRDIRICSKDVTMTLHDPANSKTNAFAIAFGEAPWSYGCIETRVAAGRSVSFKAYIRPFGRAGESRTVTIKTADGEYIAPQM